MAAITIMDRVTLRRDDAAPWRARLEEEYAPGARQRGMRLAGVWSTFEGADVVEVCVMWELEDVAAFWAMRRAAREDPAVRDWWAETDAMALERHRRVYGSADTPELDR